MKLRTIAVLALVLLAVLGVGNDASAHDIAYPPLAEACDRYPGEAWDVPADEVVEAYPGCFIDESVDASGDITCPGGTVAKGNYCVPAVDHHIDSGENDCPGTWVEIVGGIVDVACLNLSEYENGIVYDAPLGVCHSGLYVAHIGMTGYLECVGPDYGAEYPDDGGHQPWREGPRGTCANWMDGYACELWQSGYNFPDEYGECTDPAYPELIPGEASGLGVATCQSFNTDDAPDLEEEPVTDPVVEPIKDDAEVEVTQGPLNGPTDSDEVVAVTALPKTGHGPQHEYLQHDETEPTITPEQRKWGLVVTAVLFVGLLLAQPWKSPQGR